MAEHFYSKLFLINYINIKYRCINNLFFFFNDTQNVEKYIRVGLFFINLLGDGKQTHF